MAFDSKDTAAFKGVWVFCEQREGVIYYNDIALIRLFKKYTGVTPGKYRELHRK